MIENNYKQKIIESIELNIKVLENGIKELGEKSNSNEKIELSLKEELLDAAIMLEIALYRAAMYNICLSTKKIRNQLTILNMNLNIMVSENKCEEFTHILSYKIVSLLTFTIDHIA